MAKNQIGNIRISKELLAEKLKLGDRQISKVSPLTPIREGISPYSKFYALDVEVKEDKTEIPIIIKAISDERRTIPEQLPTSGKLVAAEVRAFEYGNDYGGPTPKFYGTETDSIKTDEGNAGVTCLFLERFDESLEDFLFKHDPDDITSKQQAHHWLRESGKAALEYYRMALEQNYVEDSGENLQVFRLSRQNLENDIKQAWANLLHFKYGKGSKFLSPTQVRNLMNWMEKYNYNQIISTCAEYIVKPLSPTEEDVDDKGKDKRALFNLDNHPGQYGINRKGDRVYLIDMAKLGFGPLSLLPAGFLCQPCAFDKFSSEDLHSLADDIFLLYENIINKREQNLDVAKKTRYDFQLLSTMRYIPFKVLSFISGLVVNYPDSAKALAELHPEWEPNRCINSTVNYLVNLEDPLTPAFQQYVNEPLKSLIIPNGNH